MHDITAKNIYCENGSTAVLLGPHTAQNGMVHIDGVTVKSCAHAVTMGSGYVEKKRARNPNFKPGRFADGTSVKNIHAIFGTKAAISLKGLSSVPEPYLKELYFDETDRKLKRVRGPSIGIVRDGTLDSWTPVIENITSEGFTYNKGIVKSDGKKNHGAWRELLAGTALLERLDKAKAGEKQR